MSAFFIVSALKDMQGALRMWLDQICLSSADKSLMCMCGVGHGCNWQAAPLLRNAAQNCFPCPLGMGMSPSAA